MRPGRPSARAGLARRRLAGYLHAGAYKSYQEWLGRGEILARTAELLETARRDPVVRLPAELVMLSRVFGVLGGLFHHYRPRIDYARHLSPVLG